MLKTLRVLPLPFLLCFLAASAKDLPKVPKVENLAPIDVTSKKVTKTIEFRKLSTLMNATDSIGRSTWGVFCATEREIFFHPEQNKVLVEIVGKMFKQQMQKYGYPEYSPGESLFEDKIGGEADYIAGATIQDLKYDQCWSDSRGRGKGYVKMKWEVYSNQLQKVVYSRVLESSLDNTKEDPVSDLEFDKRLYAGAINNLLADQKFVDMFYLNAAPTMAEVELAPINIPSSAKAPGNAATAQKQLVAGVVTIESGVVSGNGFFISPNGYILTNQNVVGNAKFVKIIQSNGRGLVGEVVRIDATRNVALVKTDATPASVLAIRLTPVEIGEEVYSIGSPLGKALTGSLTRGIISAKRTENGLSYLQSDVAVTEYAEGAPLVDKHGSVVGLSQAGLHTKSLNFFTPIAEAIDKLVLAFSAAPLALVK